eukprot:1917966-Pleurochrysis_carterae.AAC.1
MAVDVPTRTAAPVDVPTRTAAPVQSDSTSCSHSGQVEHECSANEVENLRAEGNEAFKAGAFKKAIRKYSMALALVDESRPAPQKLQSTPAALLYSNRCQAYLALQDVMSALRDAESAVKIAPDWPKAHFRLGKVHEKRNELTKAYAAFKRGWHLDTSNSELTQACRDTFDAIKAADAEKRLGRPVNTTRPATELRIGGRSISGPEESKGESNLPSAGYTSDETPTNGIEKPIPKPALSANAQSSDTNATPHPAPLDPSDAEHNPVQLGPDSTPELPTFSTGEESVQRQTEPQHEWHVDEDKGHLRLVVPLPSATSMESVGVELGPAGVALQLAQGCGINLEWPRAVHDAQAKAAFSKKHRRLTITVPFDAERVVLV